MRHARQFIALISFVAFAFGLHAEEKTFRISGTVGFVGSNLGTTIQAGVDPFEILLRFETVQTPQTGAGFPGGLTSSYRLLETTIRIYGDSTYTWGFSTPLMDNVSHDFAIHNDTGNPLQDKFTTGSSLAYTGPTLGPSNKAFSHWGLTFINSGATYLSDTSIPASVSLAPFNTKLIDLTFVGYMAADQIKLTATTFEYATAAIPEPSTWAALLGAGALGIAVWHRRRKAHAVERA
jgi:hypothetical protein